MLQVNTRTTVVRTAVARFESTPVTPIFAKTAVSPAKKADSSAQKLQFMECFHLRVLAPDLRRPLASGNGSSAKRKCLLPGERRPLSRDRSLLLVTLG